MRFPHVGIAALQALTAEALQIGEAVRLARRQREAGQVVVTKFKVERAHIRDDVRVVERLRHSGKEGAHFRLVLEVEVVGGKAHTILLADGLAGLDTEQHILRVRVLSFQIVRVIRADERDPRLAGNADEPTRRLRLLRDTVVLQLQIKRAASEQCVQLLRLGLGLGIASVHQLLRNVPGEAAGQTDKPLRVLVQQLPVDTRLAVKAADERLGHEAAEVVVARLVAAQKNEVGVRRVEAVFPPLQRARRDVHLAADDGLYPRLATGAVERDSAVHDAVVGHGKRCLSQLLGAERQRRDTTRAVKQAVFAVDMKMNKGHDRLLLL